MAYTKTTWADRAVQFPNRYDKSAETSAQVTLVANPGTVTQAGTPLNAANLNKIEQGVADAHDGVATSNAHIAATTGIHGAVSTATANKMVIRDANGRSQFADPSAAADAATKGYVDGNMLTGSYTGNGVTRTIVVGFTPRFVNIVGPRLSGATGAVDFSLTSARGVTSAGEQLLPNTHCVANGFQLGDGTYANGSGLLYEWTAWR